MNQHLSRRHFIYVGVVGSAAWSVAIRATAEPPARELPTAFTLEDLKIAKERLKSGEPGLTFAQVLDYLRSLETA